MFHTSLRAAALSRFVSEMYPDESNTKKKKGINNNSDDTDNMKHVGAIVNAALTFAARQEHAPLDRILGIDELERNDIIEWQNGEHSVDRILYNTSQKQLPKC